MFLLSLGVVSAGSLALILLFCRVAVTRGILLRNSIPAVGGIAAGIAFLCAARLWLPGTPGDNVTAIIAASIIILVFGLVDDIVELSVTGKFLTQIFAAVVLIAGGVSTKLVYIGPEANTLITILWIVGITNAFNHLDVMDGVAGISAFISCAGLGAIAFINNDVSVAAICMFLCAGLAVFLMFNLPPARVYLGNAGAHFVGFIIAASALKISYAPSRISLAVFAPLIILCFPIIDTLFLICMRIKRRKSIFQKSDDHVVLRLAAIGFPKKVIVKIVFLASLVFSALGIATVRVPEGLLAAIILTVFFFSSFFLIKISAIEMNGQ